MLRFILAYQLAHNPIRQFIQVGRGHGHFYMLNRSQSGTPSNDCVGIVLKHSHDLN